MCSFVFGRGFFSKINVLGRGVGLELYLPSNLLKSLENFGRNSGRVGCIGLRYQPFGLRSRLFGISPYVVFSLLLRCPYCSYSIWPEDLKVNLPGGKRIQCFQGVRKKIYFLFPIKTRGYKKNNACYFEIASVYCI